jgi:RNA polymerase-binding protein DksA
MSAVTTHAESDATRLQQERQETVEKLERLNSELRSLAEPSADEGDTDAYEREKMLALVHSLRRKLESLDHALEMAQKGTYGICESCGDRIDRARLEILPQATLCLDCQRAFERRNKRGRWS